MNLTVRTVRHIAHGQGSRPRTDGERAGRRRRYYDNLEAERASARARMAKVYERRRAAA